MQLNSVTFFFNVLFAGSLSTAVSVLSRQEVRNKAFWERANPQITEKKILSNVRLKPLAKGSILLMNEETVNRFLFPQ